MTLSHHPTGLPVRLDAFRAAQHIAGLDAALAAAPPPCPAEPPARPLSPAYEPPHPDSPVGRTRARLEADRAAGVLPGAEPGQGTEVLRYLTDHELGAWTEAILAEHHRRRCQFADYREGARRAAGS